MPASQDPNLGLNYGWDGDEAGINLQLDENWLAIGTLVQLSVISKTTDIPGTPNNGDRYIIPAAATGVWSGHDGKVARYADAWEIYTPSKGWECNVEDEDVVYRHDGSNWNKLSYVRSSINSQSGTTYTLAATDEKDIIRCGNAGAITVTVPLNSSESIPTGAEFTIVQSGAGQVTLSPESGSVTINSPETLKTRSQFSTIKLVKVSTNEWDLSGDLEAV